MTITIPDHLQHQPPADGFSDGFTAHPSKTSVSATLTTDTQVLSVSANVVYADATLDTGVKVIPALRPFHNAALHVVGTDFIDSFTGLTTNQIRRFR